MKIEKFNTDLDFLNQEKKTKNDYSFVVRDYYSREERHYCAFLFAWLLQESGNIKKFLLSFDKSLVDKSESINNKNVKLFYEFTWLRDIIYEFGRHTEFKGQRKEDLKSALNNFVFKGGGDIQKKKPDLAIYLRSSKKLILIEAKFEGGFDDGQIDETKNYGEALKILLGKEVIKESVVALIGRQYYLKGYHNISHLSWEDLVSIPIIQVKNIKDEIEKGLQNQIRIHPKTK